MKRASLGLMLMLSGCAVGPDFHQPAAPKQQAYTPEPLTPMTAPEGLAGGTQQVRDGVVAEDWWRLFGSDQLDALITRALAANSDLAAARAALDQARESWKAQRGVLFPTVDAGAGSSRNKSSQYLSAVPGDNSYTYSLQTAQVTVGYTLDLFGANRRGVEQAHAQFDAQRFQTEGARISLINTVAATAFQEASLRGQIAAQERMIAIQSETLDILHRQQAQGQAAGADVLAQEALLAQSRAALPPLQRALAQSRDLLAYLTGGSAGDGSVSGIDLDKVTLPRDLPLSLPSALVRQRPDVRAAEANLHAASAGVGVAIANRLPQLTLTASAGGQSGGWANLLSVANTFWSVGGGIAQPIFAGGSLLHKQRAAQAAYRQADAQYRSAVLGAFQNVADVLQALQTDAAALDAAVQAQHSAEASLAIARRQYQQGQIAFPTMLAAEQTLRQAEQSLVQAQTARLTDTAALFEALGGGWRPDSAPK
ncbi:efflux transporter outer membrane subunit [Novosphingobium terrae]|uniref:efflux transporter outer membrane subunit n=1 Tax=Novosphingobium terrae TaxID=2726189 RepID=UPI00197EC4EE|nr:efflux transporter outer membrane subunit [Novosphingobium terrae]